MDGKITKEQSTEASALLLELYIHLLGNTD
jgi:hypothetical protein